MLAGMFVTVEARAQYRPTQKDVGDDCTTQDGKLGTWKNVRVEDVVGNEYENSNTTSGSGGVNISGVASGSISTSDTNSRNTSNSEKISYDDIRCVEDKNATLPQRKPVRW